MLYQLSYVRLALNDSEAPAQLFDGSKGGGIPPGGAAEAPEARPGFRSEGLL